MGPDPQYVGKVSVCLLVCFFPLLRKLWGEMRVEMKKNLKRHEMLSELCYRMLLFILNNSK